MGVIVGVGVPPANVLVGASVGVGVTKLTKIDSTTPTGMLFGSVIKAAFLFNMLSTVELNLLAMLVRVSPICTGYLIAVPGGRFEGTGVKVGMVCPGEGMMIFAPG